MGYTQIINYLGGKNEMKTCPKCGKDKEASEFDKHQRQCRGCREEPIISEENNRRHERHYCPHCLSIYYKKVKEYACLGKKVNIHYVCNKCGKSFAFLATKEFHERRHTGEPLIRTLKAKEKVIVSEKISNLQ